ncbi:MAG: hypothetical protein ACR2JC_01115 [Chloroflexota bacterium]
MILSVLLAGKFGTSGDASSFHLGTDLGLVRVVGAQLDRAGLPAVRRWMRVHPQVRSAALGADGKTVMLTFPDGVHAALLTSVQRRARTLPETFGPQVQVRAPVGGRALVLEPFATELGLGSTAGDPEVQALKKSGFTVDQLYDEQVTLSSMATLHTYDVVYMQTHSGVNPGGEGVVATGQIPKPGDNAEATLLQNGSVLLVHVSGSDQVYYGITSTYIRNYEDTFPGNSILFLNGCRTLLAPIFWEALQSKGVSALVSWNKEATTKDNYLSAAAFFNEMATGLSVRAALSAAQAAGYGTSQVNNEQAELDYLGDGSLTLARAANPPPTMGTPGGTHPLVFTTPISGKPPLTVPLPGRGPMLTVTVRRKVVPGKQQVISILSSPDTTIHIHIAFPSGDTRTLTTATNGSGHARFIFPQHPDRVAFQQVFATITVQAVRGLNSTQAVKRYRIAWSHLDLAILPRRQSVGRMVTIEVHSRRFSPVALRMRFPSGVRKTLQGVTGPHGWLRITYRIGHYLKQPNKHVVVVKARVRAGGHVYRAKNTYVIL